MLGSSYDSSQPSHTKWLRNLQTTPLAKFYDYFSFFIFPISSAPAAHNENMFSALD